jgi:hypothetical protein
MVLLQHFHTLCLLNVPPTLAVTSARVTTHRKAVDAALWSELSCLNPSTLCALWVSTPTLAVGSARVATHRAAVDTALRSVLSCLNPSTLDAWPYFMRYTGGPARYREVLSYPTTLKPVGGQPPIGLRAARGMAAHRASLKFSLLTPSEHPMKYGQVWISTPTQAVGSARVATYRAAANF